MTIQVSKSEGNLLSIAQTIFGFSVGENIPLLRREFKGVDKISPGCYRVLKGMVQNGMIIELMRRGGWANEMSTSESAISKRGRAWDRHEVIDLKVTKYGYLLLSWLTKENIQSPKKSFTQLPKTLGDHVLTYLSMELFQHGDDGLKQSCFQSSPLCWLGYADLLGSVRKDVPEIDFSVVGKRGWSVVIECLQIDLAKKWLAFESGKSRISSIKDMVHVSGVQLAVLSSFLDACEKYSRRDLATFIVDTALALLKNDPTPQYWTQKLEKDVTMSQRQQAFHAAASFLDMVTRIYRWHQEHGAIHHFEDEYKDAQILLSRWDQFGNVGFQRAASIAAELKSLQSL